jgi:hypothetical protein
MLEPPEILNQITTPAKIVARLDAIRERYRMGLIDPPGFNEVLKLFQFRDATNRIWTPGARTNQWYRLDGRDWVAANPPEQLQLPALPLELAPEPERPPLPPPQARPTGPGEVTCPTCGAPNVGKKFCTSCGTKLIP